MTTRFLAERLIREVYGKQKRNDSPLTINLVASYVRDAISVAAKQNYTDSIKLDAISYVNSSFYTTYKNLTVTADEKFTYKILLPDTPIGIGRNEGVSSLQFKDTNGNVSQNCLPLSTEQKAYYSGMRTIPNRICYWMEGRNIYAVSDLILSSYTASVGMISTPTDLDADMNIPNEYISVIEGIVMPILMRERAAAKETVNDGLPA